MASLRFSPASEAEIDAIASHIRNENPMAVQRWVLQLEDKSRILALHPGMGHRRDEIEAEVHCFPFGKHLILYDIAPDGIEVPRVVHGARDLRRVIAD